MQSRGTVTEKHAMADFASPSRRDSKYVNFDIFGNSDLSTSATNLSQNDCHDVTSPANFGNSILGSLTVGSLGTGSQSINCCESIWNSLYLRLKSPDFIDHCVLYPSACPMTGLFCNKQSHLPEACRRVRLFPLTARHRPQFRVLLLFPMSKP